MFISYRQNDSRDIVEPLAEWLREDLGARSVFRDLNNFIAGEEWSAASDAWLTNADAAIFVVGERWVGQRENDRRIDYPHDPVRHEVELALGTSPATPIPLMVDIDRPPDDLPTSVEGLFKHHAVVSKREQLLASRSGPYQQLLVGIWAAIQRRVGGGVLVMGDGPKSMVDIDQVVAELRSSTGEEFAELSRFASGAILLDRKNRNRMKKQWPDVIVVPPTASSVIFDLRMAALNSHPMVGKVALVGTGSSATLAGTNSTEVYSTVKEIFQGAERIGRSGALASKPVLAGAALAGAAAVGALLILPLQEVGAIVQHANIEFELLEGERTEVAPFILADLEVGDELEDPDPGVDHFTIHQRVTSLGFNSNAMRFHRVPVDEMFALLLEDGTSIPAQWITAVDRPTHNQSELGLIGFEEAEYHLTFPLSDGQSEAGARLEISMFDYQPTTIDLDAGRVDPLVVEVFAPVPTVAGRFGREGDTGEFTVTRAWAQTEAPFDDAGEPLLSPDSNLRRRARAGHVFVYFEGNARQTAAGSMGPPLISGPRPIVDGEELDKGRITLEIERLPGDGTAVDFYGMIEVPIDATDVVIGFVGASGLTTYNVHLEVALDPSFLDAFAQAER